MPASPTKPSGRFAFGLVLGTTVVVAACSILYELLLAQTLSALLGNTVLRYSITIGCYLGALGVGAIMAGSATRDPVPRLVRVELGLSVLGGLAVPAFFLLDGLQRYLSNSVAGEGAAYPAIGFMVLTHAIIVAIGVLSGFEIPLLIALGERVRAKSTNLVLGLDYFGSLVGSVLFPLVLLPHAGLLTTGFAIALLNAAALVVLLVHHRPAHAKRYLLAAAGIAPALGFGIARADAIEHHFVEQLYFSHDVESPWELLAPNPKKRDVDHYQSRYQTIDVVRDRDPDQWLTNAVSRRLSTRPDRPDDVWLYLEGEFQLFSGADEFYHEWFVHAPVQATGRVPRRVALLGGGDGLALEQILAYEDVERVVHVELDDLMLGLAREHPALSELHEDPWSDPRVELVIADAFSWLRSTDERFDAIYVDMPYARDHNISMVYSREFYGIVRSHLSDRGYLALDSPSGWCGWIDSDWPIFNSTLQAAGFQTVVPFLSRLDWRSPALDRAAGRVESYGTYVDGEQRILTGAEARAYYRDRLVEGLGTMAEHDFILAFPDGRRPRREWTAFDVPLNAFGPHELMLAFDETCPAEPDPGAVNSIFRPTMPTLEFASFRAP